MAENLSPVLRTLETYVPAHFRRHILVVGTAGLVLQGIRIPYEIPDVDVLAPFEYLEDLHDKLSYDKVGNTSQLDYATYDILFRDTIAPKGELRRSVCLKPNERHPELLRFQAFYGIRDDVYDIDYDRARKLAVPTLSSYAALPTEKILEWKAAIGRDKDRDLGEQLGL
jgi:hypothetical protein